MDVEEVISIFLNIKNKHNNKNYYDSEGTDILLNNGKYTLMPADHWLWFFVTSDWNVYPNFMGLSPWWKLGNLKKDNWKKIIDNYKNNNNLGLKVMNQISAEELAQIYGDTEGKKLYNSESQLVEYWVEKYCRDYF